MLLIAQPKSASTSLMWTISTIARIPHKNGQNKRFGDKKCYGYIETQKYHGTTVERSFGYLKKYIDDRHLIYKEHILPTPQHLQKIKKCNKNVVVLLRDPITAVNAYQRVFDVIDINIDMNKLKEEMIRFYWTYKGIEDKRFLIITYKELMLDYVDTMKKIFKQYGLELPNKIPPLAKRNYTGDGLKELKETK